MNADQPPHDREMSLIEHLTELRSRLLRAVLAVGAVFLAIAYYANPLYQFVSEPLRRYLPPGASMIATEVGSPFVAPFKLAFVIAALLAMPYVLHQAWAFVAPGMYRHERRFALPLLVSSVVLFYAGVAFAYFVVCPLVFAFVTATTPEGVLVMTDINRYLDFVLAMFFAFGFAFEVPVATVLMVWAGLTTPASLAHKRPYIVLGCFVVGMVLTPPDVIAQILLALPMWFLFETGVLASRLLVRSQAKLADASAPRP